MRKKATSILLTCCLALTLLPFGTVPAVADNPAPVVLSDHLTLTDATYFYEEGEDEYNPGSVGSVCIMGTVTGPAEICYTAIASWSDSLPTAEKAKADAERMASFWKNTSSHWQKSLPFQIGDYFPVDEDDLGKTWYVILCGLDSNWDAAGYAVVKVELPGGSSSGSGGSGSGGGPAASIIASGDCGAQGNNLTWTLDDKGVLTISGKGEMANYSYAWGDSPTPWQKYWETIREIVIQNGVTSVGGYAFNDYSNVIKATIPDSVAIIGERAFYATSLPEIALPNTMSAIGIEAFAGTNLSKITIPSSVTTISRGAFGWCNNLSDVTIPNGVSTIEDHAFCFSALKKISIPAGVTNIGSHAFFRCLNLAEVYIPGSVNVIGNSAFSYAALSEIMIPEGVTTIEASAFECTNLSEVTIPASVTSIGRYAFSYNPLKKISVAADNPAYSSVDGVLFNKDRSMLILYPPEGERTYSIPKSVLDISEYAFGGCRKLNCIAFPDNMNSIGSWAFSGCDALCDIVLPANIENIKEGAFYNCTSIADVYYGGSNALWNTIYIEESNEPITSDTVTVHYFSGPTPFTVKDAGTRTDPTTGEAIQYETRSDDSVAVFGDVSKTTPVLVASYDECGRMSDLTFLTEPGRADLSAGDTARLFWLGAGSAPKCDFVSIK